MKGLSRRKFLADTGSVFLSGSLIGGALVGCARNKSTTSDTSNRLNLYIWADYLHPDVIPSFEKQFGIQVFVDTFGSNEAMLAKLQAGATAYDIVVPSSYTVGQMVRLNLLESIDHAQLANFSHLMRAFLDPTYDRGLQFSIPYAWGTTGIGYNESALSKLYGNASKVQTILEQQGFNIFWEPKLSQRMTLLDDERETIGMSLKRDQESYNCRDVNAIKRAVQALQRQKPLLMCYTSDQVIIQLAAGDSLVALGYSGDVAQATRANPNIKFAVPKSGTSTWVDSFCILKTAPHKEAAYKWIDYLLNPSVAAKNADYTRYATPNEGEHQNVYLPEELLSRCETVLDVGKLSTVYDRFWTDLKCS